jgi:5'-nucleotidase
VEEPRVIYPKAWQIRIAFDGDAVLFSDESERIYKEKGLGAFEENERENAENPLNEGPFANFLKKLSGIRQKLGTDNCPIRIALVTARSAPAHERVIKTLRSWNVRVDEAFFLGGIDKREVLRAFGAQIFFDDQSIHTLSASMAVPAARVPYRQDRKREELINEVSTCCTG